LGIVEVVSKTEATEEGGLSGFSAVDLSVEPVEEVVFTRL